MSASRITFFRISFTLNEESSNDPVDTGRKLNVHKTFRRRPGRTEDVLGRDIFCKKDALFWEYESLAYFYCLSNGCVGRI